MNVPFVKRLCLVGLTVLLLGPPGPKLHAQKPIDFEHAMTVMNSFEARIERIQWNVRRQDGTLKDLNDPASFVPSEPFSEGWLLFEPKTGRCRGEVNSVMHWSGGTASFSSSRASFGFDGEVYRIFEKDKGGTQLPNEGDPGIAVLETVDRAKKNQEESARTGVDHQDGARKLFFFEMNLGLQAFPPYFGGDRPMSQLLRENRAKGDVVEISENKDGNWEMKMSNPPASHYAGDPREDPHRGFITLVYSPVKGAVLSADTAIGNPPVVYQRSVRELQETNGFWVPKIIRSFNPADKSTTEIRYSNVKVNQPVEDAVFRFDFPQKARVIDHVEKKIYSAGDAAVDEAKASRDYRISQGLPLQNVGILSSRTTWILATLIVLSLVAGYLFWRNRRHRIARVQ